MGMQKFPANLGEENGKQNRRMSLHNIANDKSIELCWVSLHAVLRNLAVARARANVIFYDLDASGDDGLDREEFQHGMTWLLRGSALLKHIDEWEPVLFELLDEEDSPQSNGKHIASCGRVYARSSNL